MNERQKSDLEHDDFLQCIRTPEDSGLGGHLLQGPKSDLKAVISFAQIHNIP